MYHVGRTQDGIKPESARHLFFSQIGPGHVNHDFPVRFHKAVCQLALGRGGHNFSIVINK
jgi:hypothetical protein